MSCDLFYSSFITLIALTLASYVKLSTSGPVIVHSISPNFTASFLQYIDHSGTFLVSPNGTFKASITNTKPQLTHYYFCIRHVSSNTIIWTTNRDNSISNSGTLLLTPEGFFILNDSKKILWSTPKLNSSVSAMRLEETGNLILVDSRNQSLWESFEHPSDTIVPGQLLSVGKSLIAAVSEEDLSSGSYRIVVTGEDAAMQWNDIIYWKLSMDAKVYKDSNSPVSFMAVNGTGLYLFGREGDVSVVVLRVALRASSFRIAKLGSDGRFHVNSYADGGWKHDLTAPIDRCRVPSVCRTLGLCLSAPGSCSCPPGFFSDPRGSYGCIPENSSYRLPSACNSTSSTSSTKLVSYLRLNNGMDYFANDFIGPANTSANLSACQDLCSHNCSCLGIFHENGTDSCYIIRDYLGSIISTGSITSDRTGYIKVLVEPSSTSLDKEDEKHGFPTVGLIILPLSGLMLLVAIIFVIWVRWKKRSELATIRLGSRNSSSSTELEIVSIPGLPVRFSYEELEDATENFRTKIGAGGFGMVYKGTMPDKSTVAVKKITCLGVQGKKEFCTEIAIIGNIHHVNLVRLKGFCVQGRQRLLVYEYMNKGSLDRTLFGNGPILEWEERYEIALGTARGLAYLHSGCVQKIIHCDVKPENILLHDNLQVKISDFGLSKLLSAEQSTFFTTMRGTRGYLAPEWLTSSAISDKTDVYSYGMVLLEIIRGRKNCSLERQSSNSIGNNGRSSSSSGGDIRPAYFPLLALQMHEEGRYPELADPRLAGRVRSGEVEKLARIALCCLHEEPMLRPSMANVVSMLEGSLPLSEPRVESLNFLRFYGRRFTEPSFLINNNGEVVMLNEEMNATTTSSQQNTDSYNSLSYMSSQQLSGPR